MSMSGHQASRPPTTPAVQAVIDLNMRFNRMFNPPKLVMRAPARLPQEEYQQAREQLRKQHQQNLRDDQAEINSNPPPAESTWKVRIKDTFHPLDRMAVDDAKRAMEAAYDCSGLRADLRAKHNTDAPSALVATDTGGYRSQHFVEHRMRVEQEMAGYGPRPGVPRVNPADLRSSMRARLAVARDSFCEDTHKYKPVTSAPTGPGKSRYDVLADLSEQSGMDRHMTARLYLTFRTVASTSSEYARVMDESTRINRIDWCRTVLEVGIFPTMKYANRAYDVLVRRSNNPRQGGMDVRSFVVGLGALSAAGTVQAKIELLWELFSLSDETLEFNELVQLVCWVYHLIGLDTTDAPQHALVLLDQVGSDETLSKDQLSRGVQEIPQMLEKFLAALSELWSRVGRLTQLPLGDSAPAPMDDRIRTLEYEISNRKFG
eukprot:TRINITY_DN17743_c0_g1_i1.p1 TRINITY_DN17743_c0_g1~~TRINITY_DN17743_c0_g1_i1.p1  ORF type:complete len:432 (+),score=84.60 TRINITY_DN17743_c0_g1_i1:157-1452(+)